MVSLSISLAVNGRCSHTRTPGSLVGMLSNGPRISLGASGLGSHMSMWLGPPDNQKRMTFLLFLGLPALAASARCFSRVGSVSPAMPVRPVCKNQRREFTRNKSPPIGLKSGEIPLWVCSVELQPESMSELCLCQSCFATSNKDWNHLSFEFSLTTT